MLSPERAEARTRFESSLPSVRMSVRSGHVFALARDGAGLFAKSSAPRGAGASCALIRSAAQVPCSRSFSFASGRPKYHPAATAAVSLATMGKVHGSLARAGKVRNQTPKVAKQVRELSPALTQRLLEPSRCLSSRSSFLRAGEEEEAQGPRLQAHPGEQSGIRGRAIIMFLIRGTACLPHPSFLRAVQPPLCERRCRPREEEGAELQLCLNAWTAHRCVFLFSLSCSRPLFGNVSVSDRRCLSSQAVLVWFDSDATACCK